MICRAKSLLTHEFVEGGFVQGKNAWIVQIREDGSFSHILVDPETVELVEPARWIPVTERLPEDREERVLVKLTDPNSIMGTPSMDTDRYVIDEWVRYGDFVTHWMPLPEPPKEDPHGE